MEISCVRDKSELNDEVDFLDCMVYHWTCIYRQWLSMPDIMCELYCERDAT